MISAFAAATAQAQNTHTHTQVHMNTHSHTFNQVNCRAKPLRYATTVAQLSSLCLTGKVNCCCNAGIVVLWGFTLGLNKFVSAQDVSTHLRIGKNYSSNDWNNIRPLRGQQYQEWKGWNCGCVQCVSCRHTQYLESICHRLHNVWEVCSCSSNPIDHGQTWL